MNSSLNSVYIIANFNTSKENFFPRNKPDHFWLMLGKRLQLTGSGWKVCLCEIQFENVRVDVGQAVPTHYQVDFAMCDGLYINGTGSNALRMIPYKHTTHQIFSRPFYMPIHTDFMDTCEIEIKLVGKTDIITRKNTEGIITCTLHFKRN